MALHTPGPVDLGIEADLLGHIEVGAFDRDEDVADALVMFQDGNPGILDDEADQPLAAPGDDQVDVLLLGQQDVHGLPVPDRNDLDGLFGHVRRLENPGNDAGKGLVGMERFGSAPSG